MIPHKENIEPAIEEFKNRILKKLKKDICSIIVFGSWMQKRKEPDDIDLLVITSKKISEEKILEIARQVSEKFFVPLSVILATKDEFKEWTKQYFPMAVSLLFGYKIIYDKRNISKDYMDDMDARLWKIGAILDFKNLAWKIPVKI